MKLTRSLIFLVTSTVLAGCTQWATVPTEQTSEGYDPSCLYRALVDGTGQHAGTSSTYASSYFYPIYVDPDRLIFANYGDSDAILYRLALAKGERIAKSIKGDTDYLSIASLQVYCAKVK